MLVYKKTMFYLLSMALYIIFIFLKLLTFFYNHKTRWYKSKEYKLMSAKYNTKKGIFQYFLREYNFIIVFIYLFSLIILLFYTSSAVSASTFLYSIF